MSTKFALQPGFDLFFVLFSCLTLAHSIKSRDGKMTLRNSTGHTDTVPYKEWQYDSIMSYFGMTGVIINANPLDACVNISGPPDFSSPYFDWFVLISEDSCDYDTKVLQSQLAGYSLAIIYQSNGSSANDTKQRWDYSPLIPVVIISENSYAIVREYLYSNDIGTRIILLDNGVNFFCTVVASIVGSLCALCVVYKIIIKPIIQSQRITVSGTPSPPPDSGKRLLRQLGTSRYKRGSYSTCVICFEEFRWLEKIRKLPCAHVFHVKCIDPWLLEHQRICPVCKQEVSIKGSESQNTETTPLLQNSNTSVNSVNA